MWWIKILALIVLISLLLFLKSVQNLHKRERASNERVFKSKATGGSQDLKALLLYQPSRHETTEKAAELVAQALSSRGYTVTMNHPSDKLHYDPEDYDVIVLGSPAYFGVASAALLDYIKKNPFVHKKVVAFVTGLTPEDTRELDQIKEYIPKKNAFCGFKVNKDMEQTIQTFMETRCGL